MPDRRGAWGYSDRFEVAGGAGHLTAEEWARATFEGAPAAVRALLILGWRLGLGLRVGRPGDPELVLGWMLVEHSPAEAVLEARSPLLLARQVFVVSDSRLAQSTHVRYERPVARPLWRCASLLHRAVMPRLLARASRTST